MIFHVPSPTKKMFSRTRYAKFSQVLGGPKTEPPNLRGTRFVFFAYRVRNMQSQKVFAYPLRDFRATSVQEGRVVYKIAFDTLYNVY